MKVVFICSSLEPGKDGVGDYTRRLAGMFIKLGNTVTALCLNDYFTTTEIVATQDIDGVQLNVIRIPFSWQHKKRMARANYWINTLNPDWLSLQFVIFSFHKKGLPFKIINSLKDLGKGRHWHIMFHELWVGINYKTSIKYFLWGSIQQQIIKQLIIKLAPDLIHTQTKLYQAKLRQLGFLVDYLPLFGNIPSTKNAIDTNQIINSKDIRVVLFGTIHPGAPIEDFIQDLLAYQVSFSVLFKLLIVGRTGNQDDIWISAFKKNGIRAEVFGELSPADISIVLSSSTFGISTTPIAFVEKSGTIAAMREHGLKVLCVTSQLKDFQSENFVLPTGIFNYCKGYLPDIIQNVKMNPTDGKVEEIGLRLATIFSKKL